MRKSVKRWTLSGLILLFVSSFILHGLLHSSSCCCSAGSGIRIPAESRCACGKTTGAESSKITLPADGCIAAGKPAVGSADLFCPVCAGLLTTDDPARTEAPLIRRGGTEVSPACSTVISTPAWLRPSPRAPPAAQPHFV